MVLEFYREKLNVSVSLGLGQVLWFCLLPGLGPLQAPHRMRWPHTWPSRAEAFQAAGAAGLGGPWLGFAGLLCRVWARLGSPHGGGASLLRAICSAPPPCRCSHSLAPAPFCSGCKGRSRWLGCSKGVSIFQMRSFMCTKQ